MPNLGTHDAEAGRILREYARTPSEEVDSLITAVKVAAEAEFLGAIVGSDPQPTAMGDLRALRLRRICEAMQRSLTALEVAAIFRVSSQQAGRLIDRMEASYPLAVNEFRSKAVVAAAKSVVLPVDTPTDEQAKLEVHFKHRHGPLAAEKLLERADQRSEVVVDGEAFRIDVPISDKDPDAAYAIVRGTLGLDKLVGKALKAAQQDGKTKGKKWWPKSSP